MLTFNRPDHRLVVCPYADHVSILVYPAGAEHPTEHITLRADELGSGLDAWTGGWWSRAATTSGSHSPRDTPEENHP